MITLSETNGHKNIMFHELTTGSMVQANQHVIVAGDEAMILDPGGHKVYTKLFAELATVIPPRGLKHVFFSHQDPDIISAANGWLMVTEATAYLSELWLRFIPHFGVDELVVQRIKPIPDEGMTVQVGNTEVKLIAAHFLHSAGNFQVYDPVAKILYTGDLGASLGHEYTEVEDFDNHVQYMKAFHQRYMPTAKVLTLWAQMARSLDIEIIAPQHGAVFKKPELVTRFIDWVADLPCGIDHIQAFAVPG